MRRQQGRGLAALSLGLALATTVAAPGSRAQNASSGSAIVQEVLKDAEQEQVRDSERVRRMVDEAVKGAEGAPSGEEAVNPTAPESLRPLLDGQQAGALPAGYSAEELRDRPVRDGSGAEIGTLRGPAVDEASGIARVMVEFKPLFGEPGKVAALEIERLTRADGRGDGYVVDVTPVDYRAMAGYGWADGEWRRRGA